MFFSCFNFIIAYHLGNQQGKLDAMSYCSFAPKQGNVTFNQQKIILLKKEQLRLMSINNKKVLSTRSSLNKYKTTFNMILLQKN
jgi:ABC-type histidine transport system ATPase subunit